jgi:ketosteroid isomerase-like protein
MMDADMTQEIAMRHGETPTAASEALRREAAAFYDAYMDAFRRGDTARLAGMATAPMARIGPTGPELVAHAPDPRALAARTGWADTVEVDLEVLDATPERAHLHLRRAVRVRADGSPIETIRGVYVLTRGAAGAWRIAVVSVIAAPV